MEAEALITVAVAFLVAGVVKGAVGMGLPTISVAIMGSVLGLQQAIPILMVPSLVANIWQIMGPRNIGGLMRRFWSLNAAACLGVWAGTMLLFRIDPGAVAILLGAVIITHALINLFAVEFTVRKAQEPVMGPMVGLCSGVLTGVTGSLLLPVIVYLQALRLDKESFIQAVGLSLLIGTVIWTAALMGEGAMTATAWGLSGLALLPTLLGMALGRWLGRRISEDKFRTGVYILLLILAANLIRKGLT
jgi:hypothetical protein